MPTNRWTQIWLCFMLSMVGYIDRTNLAVAAPFLKHGLHIGDAAMGVILGSFFWTYAGLQLPSGWLVDRIRLRTGIAAAVTLWSLATMATAAARGATSLFALRLLLGVGEAPIFPTAAKVIGAWFGPGERGRAAGLFQCGSRTGSIVALPLVSAGIAWCGWRASFLITGALGIVVAVAWLRLFRDAPEETAATAAPPPVTGLLTVLRHRCFIGIAAGEFLMLVPTYFYITWLPSYLVRARGFSLAELATLGALPAMAGLFPMYLGGRLSDHLVRRGWPISVARKVALSGGMLLGSSIILVPFVPGTAGMIALFCASNVGLGCTSGLVFALPAEFAPNPRMVGTVTGLMNGFGNIAGIVSPAFIGALLSITGGSFDLALIVLGATCLIGAASFHYITGEIAPIPPAMARVAET